MGQLLCCRTLAAAALILGSGASLSAQTGKTQHTGGEHGSKVDTLRVRRDPLPVVTTTADEANARLHEVGFHRRRLYTGVPASQFMTRDEIAKYATSDLSQLLRRIKGRGWGCADGVLFVDGVLLAAPLPERPQFRDTPRMQTAGGSRSALPPATFAAQPMPTASELDRISVNSVEAIEVYTGPSEIPVEFNAAFRQARCVVLVWIR